jgi:hypothetical protein
MRDEVLAEWQTDQGEPVLAVHCHVSGGLVFGPAKLRDAIFRRELPYALQAFRFGDRRFFSTHPAFDSAPIVVHFHAKQSRYRVSERWGTLAEYL